jgi:hypothetical protein
MRSMPRGSGIRSAVGIIEVARPLALALDGGATVFSRAAAFELSPKVNHGEAFHCWCACHHRCA